MISHIHNFAKVLKTSNFRYEYLQLKSSYLKVFTISSCSAPENVCPS